MGSAVSGLFSTTDAGYIERCRSCIERFDWSSSAELYVSFAIEVFSRKAGFSAWAFVYYVRKNVYRPATAALNGVAAVR